MRVSRSTLSREPREIVLSTLPGRFARDSSAATLGYTSCTRGIAGGDNMKNVTRSGWILVGVVLGALATSWTAPTLTAQNDQPRLRVTLTSANLAQAAFIKDTKSSGCWFVVANAGVAIAPPEACK